MKLSFIFLCSLACCIYAKPLQHEWTIVGKPSPGHEVKLTFAIKQTNPDWLKEKLRAVSYPDSPLYTHYMNFDEIAQHVYGEPESVKAVTKELESMRAIKIDFTIGRDFLVAFVPYEAAEKYFNAKFNEFESTRASKQRIVASLSSTIPEILKKHIDFISGLNIQEYKAMTNQKIFPQKTMVTPTYIDKQYNISEYNSSNPQNSQAVAAFVQQYFNPSDLKTFQEKFSLPLKPVKKTVGPNTPSEPGFEATSDVEYISAIGRNVDTWFVSIAGAGSFLTWIVGQVNTTDSPWVHSVSYGEMENPTDRDRLLRVENEFMKFGVSGRTVLFASGDSGVDCMNGKFKPEWPTSSPHVTSVGGAANLNTVWRYGGGGFSNVFSTPDWQKKVVEGYLNSGQAPSKSFFNVSGRAYPDVSAFATNFEIILKGKEQFVNGTSLSTPTVAGIISILNDVRLNKGQKTLGFLNPLLYTTLKGKGFFDVINGSNDGIGDCSGFKAIKGWDPASGWGQPNFGLLKNNIV